MQSMEIFETQAKIQGGEDGRARQEPCLSYRRISEWDEFGRVGVYAVG